MTEPNPKVPERITLAEQIDIARTGTCSCGVKSPELFWHDENCRWKMLGVCADRAEMEASTLAAAVSRAREEALREAAEVCTVQAQAFDNAGLTLEAKHMRDIRDRIRALTEGDDRE